jgi:hypothetical protein
MGMSDDCLSQIRMKQTMTVGDDRDVNDATAPGRMILSTARGRASVHLLIIVTCHHRLGVPGVLKKTAMSFAFPAGSQQTSYFAGQQVPQTGTFGDLASLSSAGSHFGVGQTEAAAAATLDPNNPALFKENLKLIQTQTDHVRTLAHSALLSMFEIFCLSANVILLIRQLVRKLTTQM